MKFNAANNVWSSGFSRRDGHISSRLEHTIRVFRTNVFPAEAGTSNRGHQRGVALVITLIMLAVITFMAVTFLVLSTRERGAVTTTTDQAVARLAAEAALDRAKAELLAPMLAFDNAQVYGFRVSTNFINSRGFDPLALDFRTNVNFQHQVNGQPLTADLALRNLTNLLFSPRPPVYLTNEFGTNEHRFYLDLNRNGRFDTNGWQPVLHPNGFPVVDQSTGQTNYDWFVGDPEWIGVLEYPERPHGPDNRFVARYVYAALPASQTLDLNYSHNQAVTRSFGGGDGFFRNQGVGTWEINLAAFLADLNSSVWGSPGVGYQYNLPFGGTDNPGIAFDDARAILAYRYAGNYANLAPADLRVVGVNPGWRTNLIDEYSDGLPQTGINPPNMDDDPVGQPWVGSDNPVHYFTINELYEPSRAGTLANRLRDLSQTNSLSSYDSYTFYRLLQQLGTDSAPTHDKINVNWRNVDNFGRVVPGLETNRLAWHPENFFTNAADRLLRTNTAAWFRENPDGFFATYGLTNSFGLTNIPVYRSIPGPGGGTLRFFGYTPTVHRALQVVANIYDATTNRPTAYPYYPTVFRPFFRRNRGDVLTNVFIAGYREVVDTSALEIFLGRATPLVDLSNPDDVMARIREAVPDQPIQYMGDLAEPMIAGIPLVIGAKKGYPNFNKFAFETAIQVTRKLQLKRAPGQPVSQTNQIYLFGISNAIGAQAWNSYRDPYPRNLRMIAVADVNMAVSNEFGQIADPWGRALNYRYFFASDTNITGNTWTGFVSPQSSVSFRVPFVTNYWFLTNSEYQQIDARGGGTFVKLSPSPWDPPNTFRNPQLWLTTRARLRFMLLDGNRIVDYVNLDSTEEPINLLQVAQGEADCSGSLPTTSDPDPGALWCTNRYGGVNAVTIPTVGIINQIQISMGLPRVVSDSFWRRFNSTVTDKQRSIETFVSRMINNNAPDGVTFETPFNPTRQYYHYIRWEANDPLVHYTIPDLTDLMGNPEKIQWDSNTRTPLRRLIAENPLNDHYRPWGGNPNNPVQDPTQVNPQFKDPLVFRSDDWNFPNMTLPNVGWLGRVHRGSPWQTVYMKSGDAGTNNLAPWWRWAGNTNFVDANWSRPVSDRLLFDIFTAEPHPNAARGRLSVNQTGLAAWSAVLSGVTVTTNAVTGDWTVIQPAALSPEVAYIVEGINATRASTNQNGFDVFPNRMFAHLGDVLHTPQLTDASPFFDAALLLNEVPDLSLRDEVYERIPQQIMGLLTLEHHPRFVIYAYGQTLRPAPASVISGGPFNQLCTNYQITAEAATRAVVRLERYGTNGYPRMVVEQFNVLPPE